MKKLLLGFVLSLLVSGAAFGAQARSNTGCGLGTMLFENKADNSIALQVLQATTNGSFGTQTFGISSGTSECAQPASIVQNEKLNQFVRANLDNLAKEMAMGKGETLDTFVEMIGVNAAQGDSAKAKLQANFGKVFTSENIVLAQVVDNAVAVVRN